MENKEKLFSSPRWNGPLVAENVGQLPITEEQRKKDEQFIRDFEKLIKENEENEENEDEK
ncbi:TPA: hypothetical protein ACGBG5_001734 [Enterococcus faecalis]